MPLKTRLLDLKPKKWSFNTYSYLVTWRYNVPALKRSRRLRTRRSDLIMDEEKDAELVTCLLELKKKLDTILTESFERNESFINSMKESFEHFINLRANRPAELVRRRPVCFLVVVAYLHMSSTDPNNCPYRRMSVSSRLTSQSCKPFDFRWTSPSLIRTGAANALENQATRIL